MARLRALAEVHPPSAHEAHHAHAPQGAERPDCTDLGSTRQSGGMTVQFVRAVSHLHSLGQVRVQDRMCQEFICFNRCLSGFLCGHHATFIPFWALDQMIFRVE